MTIMVIMVVAIMIPIPVAVPVLVPVPMVIVLIPAAIPIPIPYKILPTLMAWPNPPSARIWRPSPVTLMPFIVSPRRIPIALDPDEFRTRARWKNPNHPGRRRRPDIDSDGNLSLCY
jgi:hypothetical protein